MSIDRYKEAGVDITAGEALVDKIRPYIEKTYREEVRGAFGHYASLFSLSSLGAEGMLLVSSTDGVGTKVELTRMTAQWERIGQDLVAMCANDILCLGAKPLFFLDYFATGRLDVNATAAIIRGIAKTCEKIHCALIGGETAEMPGLYRPGDFDMAGFIVGAVAENSVIDGSRIDVGNRVIGLASDGFHANGFSLVRKIVSEHKLDLENPINGDSAPLGELLTRPTRLYGPLLEPIIENAGLRGLAHITGGGLLGNLPRILPPHCCIRIDRSRWERPPLFAYFQRLGEIADREMLRVFNDGIGMVLVLSEKEAETITAQLESSGETVWQLGHVEARQGKEAAVVLS